MLYRQKLINYTLTIIHQKVMAGINSECYLCTEINRPDPYLTLLFGLKILLFLCAQVKESQVP